MKIEANYAKAFRSEPFFMASHFSAVEDHLVSTAESGLIAATERAEQTKRRASILLVEDNPADVLLVREALKGAGVLLTVAVDGEDALSLLAQASVKPDLIILDLNLPKVDGFTVLERYHLNTAPVVVFSSTQDRAEQRRALSLGAREFVHKPGDFFEFVEAVTGIAARFLSESDVEE